VNRCCFVFGLRIEAIEIACGMFGDGNKATGVVDGSFKSEMVGKAMPWFVEFVTGKKMER